MPAVLEQVAYRFRHDNDGEIAATWMAATNTAVSVLADHVFRLRFGVLNSGDAAINTDWQLFRRLNGGSWEKVDATTSVVRSVDSPHIAGVDPPTTQQITSGLFTAGRVDDNDGYISAFSLAAGRRTEHEFAVEIVGAGVVAGDTVEFRVTLGDWTPLDAYPVIPSVTVAPTTIVVLPMDDINVEIAPGGDPDDPSTWVFVSLTDPDLPDYPNGRVQRPVTIVHGRSSEGSTAPPAQVSFDVRNEDGALSPDNPLGPWYGDLGVGTPLRVTWGTSQRFEGLISELPTRWLGLVVNSRVMIRADGVTRRLDEQSEILQSALFRSWSTRSDAIAYWPGEDPEGSDSVSSPMRGVSSFSAVGLEFAAVDGPPGSDRLIRVPVGAKNVMGRVPAHPESAGYVVHLLWRMDEQPTARRRMMRVDTTSPTLALWQVSVSDTLFQVQAFDNDGTEVINSTQSVNLDVFGQWVSVRLLIVQSGTSVDWTARVYSSDPALEFLQSLSATKTSSTIGRITQAGVASGTFNQDRHVGHILVLRRTTVPTLIPVVRGYPGERAAVRFQRLCNEEGLDCTIIGDANTSMPMGPQGLSTLLDLWREIERTDGGIFHDSPLTYRVRTSLYNQDSTDIEFCDLDGSPEPIHDTRPVGNGVNPHTDARLPLLAAWQQHLSVPSEMRWPRIPLHITSETDHLRLPWLGLKLGDRITIPHDIPQLPGVEIDLLVDGWSETIHSRRAEVAVNAVPAAPYRVWELEHATFGRVWSPRPYLATGIDDDDTSFDVIVPVQRAYNPVPDFESEISTSVDFTDDYRVRNGTLTRSKLQAFTGRWSGRFQTAAGTSVVEGLSPQGFIGPNAVPYRASMWVYSPGASVNVIGFLSWYGGPSGNQPDWTEATSGTVGISADTWTRVVVNAQAPVVESFVTAGRMVNRAAVGINVSSSTQVVHLDLMELGRPGAPFATSGIFPMPIIMGGEVMSVTAIGADDGTGKQTFTVTRGVNGVAKPHARGSELHIGHVVAL